MRKTLLATAIMGSLFACANPLAQWIKKYAFAAAVATTAVGGSSVEAAQDPGVDRYAKEDQVIYEKNKIKVKPEQQLELRSLNGDKDATYELFVLNFRGYIVPINIPRAKRLLEACDSVKCNDRKIEVNAKGVFNNIVTEKIEPWRTEFSTFDKNKDGLSDDLENEAIQGNKYAEYQLGKIYYEGTDKINKDENKAYKWIFRSALKGVDDARYLMGQFYENGVVVKRDNKKALPWYRAIAENEQKDNPLEVVINAKQRIDALTKEADERVEKYNKKYKTLNVNKIDKNDITSVKLKERLLLKLRANIVNGYSETAIQQAEKEINEKTANDENRYKDNGWSFNNTSISYEYVAIRSLRTINPYPETIELKWKINTRNEEVRRVK